ncbi:Stealth CR1 domain-containing protein [Kitasatospora sp. NPDC050543]|uniref:stealth family protein n=1 Tax=Kitasatospora sp. NPDC050543 TaxID=3364054 RepID=UPI0037B947CE
MTPLRSGGWLTGAKMLRLFDPPRAGAKAAQARPGPRPPHRAAQAPEAEPPPGHPALVADGALLAEVREDLRPAAVRAANLALAAAPLLDHGIPYVLAPDARRPDEPERHHIAVALEHRAAVLGVLESTYAGRHVYLEPISWGPGPGPLPPAGLTAAVERCERSVRPAEDGGAEDDGTAQSQAAQQRLVRGVRVFRPFVTAGRTLRYGPEYGCEIKFWRPAGDSGGSIIPYGDTRAGWWVPSLEPAATVGIAGGRHPVPAAFTRQLIDDVDFPIDAVYTWVDDTDPRWRERRARRAAHAGAGAAGPGHGTEEQRFRNRDELRYSLRSLAMYAPWIRHVFLVTDDQVPAWLDTAHPGLTLVSHRELFGDPDLLPVFNSRAIESQLHRIEGLGEHFVYFNDDMFLGREVGPGFFFQSNGAARLFQDDIIPPDPTRPEDDSYIAGQKNTRDAVAGRYGRCPTRTFSHAPRSAHRSLLRQNARDFAPELRRTAAEAFRSLRSLSPLTLYGYTAYLAGRAVFADADEVFVDIGDPQSLRRLPELIAERGPAVFCLNDVTAGLIDPADQESAVRTFLTARFPVAGPFEKQDPDAGYPPAELPHAEHPPARRPAGDALSAPRPAGAGEGSRTAATAG